MTRPICGIGSGLGFTYFLLERGLSFGHLVPDPDKIVTNIIFLCYGADWVQTFEESVRRSINSTGWLMGQLYLVLE